MSKGSAKELDLGRLHSKLTTVFERVLERYLRRLEVQENVSVSDQEFEQELLDEIFDDSKLPNPAMLNAVAAFLKQNEIRFDDEKVGKLNALQAALDERKQRRANIIQLSQLKPVDDA